MDTEYIFKNNASKYFYYPILFCLFIDLVLSFGFYLFKADVSINLAFKIFKPAFLFSTVLYKIPLIIIFVSHIKYSSKKRISLLGEKNQPYIIIDSNQERIKIPYEKIKKIDSFLGPPKFDKRMSWIFWDNFFYYKITTCTEDSYIISCLICDTLFEHIPVEKNKRHKIIFPLIFGDVAN